MRSLIKLFFIAAFLFSCDFTSKENKEVILRREKVKQAAKPEKQHLSNKILELDVEGMSCEMGCGGAIRTGVIEMGGVERVRFDFVEGEKKQRTFITFDDNQIKKEKIIDAIKELNDKQFSVHEVSLKKYEYEVTNPTTGAATSNSDKPVSNPSISIIPAFEIPNIMDVLSDFISG